MSTLFKEEEKGSIETRDWEIFIDNFQDWTKEIFDITAREAITDLRNYPREKGVFVYRAAQVSISGELAKTANEVSQHVWTQEGIMEVIEKDEPFNSRHHPDYRSERMSVINSQPPSPSAQIMTELKMSGNLPKNVKGKGPEMREFQKIDPPRIYRRPAEDYQSGYVQPTTEPVDEIEHNDGMEYYLEEHDDRISPSNPCPPSSNRPPEPQSLHWPPRRNQRQQTEDYNRPYTLEGISENAPRQRASLSRPTMRSNRIPAVQEHPTSYIPQPFRSSDSHPQQLNARQPKSDPLNANNYHDK